MPGIPVNRVVDNIKIIRKREGQGEKERHKGSLTPKLKKNCHL
jgi:hypothetical protein